MKNKLNFLIIIFIIFSSFSFFHEANATNNSEKNYTDIYALENFFSNSYKDLKKLKETYKIEDDIVNKHLGELFDAIINVRKIYESSQNKDLSKIIYDFHIKNNSIKERLKILIKQKQEKVSIHKKFYREKIEKINNSLDKLIIALHNYTNKNPENKSIILNEIGRIGQEMDKLKRIDSMIFLNEDEVKHYFISISVNLKQSLLTIKSLTK